MRLRQRKRRGERTAAHWLLWLVGRRALSERRMATGWRGRVWEPLGSSSILGSRGFVERLKCRLS